VPLCSVPSTLQRCMGLIRAFWLFCSTFFSEGVRIFVFLIVKVNVFMSPLYMKSCLNVTCQGKHHMSLLFHGLWSIHWSCNDKYQLPMIIDTLNCISSFPTCLISFPGIFLRFPFLIMIWCKKMWNQKWLVIFYDCFLLFSSLTAATHTSQYRPHYGTSVLVILASPP
jgi:hypothetical protein